ncbi:MAG: glycosyltransferase family 2 protein [Synergistaceae bacterium]|jgi:cellulose synthase/poly-beta-1,6-N-acetylglucosamine synthase-like glycosyltransferase|nr:glycosyltransferase family 2 protein [Synergistaceae bacterium]
MSVLSEYYYWAIWWGWWVVQFCLYTLFSLLFADAAYQFVIGFRGLFRQRDLPAATRYRRFAVLVPAHNEAMVLGPLLESLREQNYPKNCYRVFVSCDNCTDNTAEVASSLGAEAMIRTDTLKNGKTWNVRWALTRIPMENFDALAMFDADNLAERDFLARMNDYMESHPEAEAIQGVLDVKNPDDNWLTRSYALAYWFTNRFWQLARGLWGLSCTLGGTGLVIRAATLRRLGWNLESLTEDLEMSTRIILSGSRVHWNDHAVIYDEKPQSLKISYKQRTRWMQGHYWVCRKYGGKALASFITTRRVQYLDLFLYLLAPGKACVALLTIVAGMAYTIINNALLFPTLDKNTPQTFMEWVVFVGMPIATTVFFCGFCAIVGPSMHRRRITLRYAKDTLAYFWFGATWIPILFKAPFISGSQSNWVKTEHTRNISLKQVERD